MFFFQSFLIYTNVENILKTQLSGIKKIWNKNYNDLFHVFLKTKRVYMFYTKSLIIFLQSDEKDHLYMHLKLNKLFFIISETINIPLSGRKKKD